MIRAKRSRPGMTKPPLRDCTKCVRCTMVSICLQVEKPRALGAEREDSEAYLLDFVRAAGAVALQERGRRAFLAAYERRMAQEVTHPRYGYQLSYRRVLAVQARLLARTVQGELATYPSFRTR